MIIEKTVFYLLLKPIKNLFVKDNVYLYFIYDVTLVSEVLIIVEFIKFLNSVIIF